MALGGPRAIPRPSTTPWDVENLRLTLNSGLLEFMLNLSVFRTGVRDLGRESALIRQWRNTIRDFKFAIPKPRTASPWNAGLQSKVRLPILLTARVNQWGRLQYYYILAKDSQHIALNIFQEF